MSKLDVDRLKEPAAWLMVAAGGLSVLLATGRVLIGSSSGIGRSLSIADRAATNFFSLTSPVTVALLLGAVLLVTKVGQPSPKAKLVTFGAVGGLGLATVFGALSLLLGLFAGRGVWSTFEFLLSGVPLLGLTAVALVYLLPQVLSARPASGPGYGPGAPYGQQAQYGQAPGAPYGQQADYAPQAGYGQHPPGQAPYGQHPGYGQPVEGQHPGFAQQSGEGRQPGYGQPDEAQPGFGQTGGEGPGFGQPGAPQPGFGQAGDGQQPGYGQAGDGQQPQPRTPQPRAALPAAPGDSKTDPGYGEPAIPGFAQPDPSFPQADPSFAQPDQGFGQTNPTQAVPAQHDQQGFGQPAPIDQQGFGQPAQPDYGQQPPGQADPGYGQATPADQSFGQSVSADQGFGQTNPTQSFRAQNDQQAFGRPTPAHGSYTPAETQPDAGHQPAAEYQPAPYVPADSQPSVYGQPSYSTADSQPNPYAPADTHPAGGYPPSADSQADPYAPPAPQPGAYTPLDAQYQPSQLPYTSQDSGPYVPPIVQPNAFNAPASGGYPSGETAPSVPFPPSPQQADQQQGGQPFTGYSGHEFATPAYQEPDPPVDPRSQQLHDAYQQAETYQHSTGQHSSGQHSAQPELRVPDYPSQPQAAPHENPFGHAQQQAQPQYGGQPQYGQPPSGAHHAGGTQAEQFGQQQYGRPASVPGQYGQSYEPQPAPYEPQPYQQQPPSSGWEPQAESTVRLDPESYRSGDALGEQRRDGDDPIDPTAIYTPNEPRR
ncbi:hypothetical protein AB0C18_13665 [Nonomuraea muscovyensis]|uniref:hypothetical protein n=1 Tax=Nonomuraea muscovyensis TaxID=1124761 RepID=UPI0033ED51A9